MARVSSTVGAALALCGAWTLGVAPAQDFIGGEVTRVLLSLVFFGLASGILAVGWTRRPLSDRMSFED